MKPFDAKQKENRLEEEVQRKAAAEQILGSYLHKEAWNVIEAHLFDQWSRTKHDQESEREALYREMKGLTRVKKYYESILTTGKLAEQEQTRLQKLAKSVKSAVRM